MADRTQFERSAPAGLAFPETQLAVTLTLADDEIDIGRAEVGGDPAVSRNHVTLMRQTDGSYAVVDHGSTNGTTVNDGPTPIEADVPVPLDDGDCIHIGAWTTITIRQG
jgi:pSer/pThr/pTyr-binding forkhead associated (FHA) protein